MHISRSNRYQSVRFDWFDHLQMHGNGMNGDVLAKFTYFKKLSFSSFNFSASFALYLIKRSTNVRFSSCFFEKKSKANQYANENTLGSFVQITCTLRSFSSSDANASCNAQCSSRRHALSDLSSCIDVVSIRTSARNVVFTAICSAMLSNRNGNSFKWSHSIENDDRNVYIR